MRTYSLRIVPTLSVSERITALVTGGVLALAGGLSRLPFVRATPINWDTVQFILALDHFNLHAHQPHPPGYILYVLMGRLANYVVGDPNIALSLLSVLFSALSGFLIWRLTLQVFEDGAIALGASILLMASPLALYYGSVGLTYMPEMALSLLVAWLAWRARAEPSITAAVLLGLSLAVAGGIRQTSLLVLLPLCLWALWGAQLRSWLAFGLTLVIACGLWLVPLLVMSGGPAAYLRENELLAQLVSSRTSLVGAGLEGLAHNLLFEGLALGVGLAFGLVPLLLWALRLVRFDLSGELKAFLTWWAMPPLILYALAHVGQYGYMLVVLPPLLLLSSLSTRVLVERWAGSWRGATWGVTACALLAVLSADYFLLAQGPTTASNIEENDAHWKAVTNALNGMDPSKTALVMSVEWYGPFRLAGYLLPKFHSYAAMEREDAPKGWVYSAYQGQSSYALPQPLAQFHIDLPSGIRSVVALDEPTAALIAGQSGLRRVALADDSSLYVLDSAEAVKGLSMQGEAIKREFAQPAVPTGTAHNSQLQR
jgi:hypothetical protein